MERIYKELLTRWIEGTMQDDRETALLLAHYLTDEDLTDCTAIADGAVKRLLEKEQASRS